ncbi:MAG: DUF7573 domain-containing protein [Halovenus sp.]
MDDASLDEFLDTGSDDGEDTPTSEGEDREPIDEVPADGETDTDDSADTQATASIDTEAVEPATPTATWTESGEHCDRCGAETQRLWTDDEAAVCRDCKEW